MAGLPEPRRDEAPEVEHESIVTKLTQLVQYTEQVKPAPTPDGSKTIVQIAQLAHALVEEISSHLKAQDDRIAELENLATTDALTKVQNRRGFEVILQHELSVARRHGVGGVLIFCGPGRIQADQRHVWPRGRR